MDQDIDTLRELEESLWRPETRFDREHMERVLHPAFVEFGQSGRRYTREEVFGAVGEFTAELRDLAVYRIDENVTLTTYVSVLHAEGATVVANRSSVWVREGGQWLLRFHQGTPVPS